MSGILGVNDPYIIPGTIGGGGGASLPADSAGYLQNDGAGNLSWDAAATPQAAGSDTQLQFNDGGTLIGGAANLLYAKTTGVVTVGATTSAAAALVIQGAGRAADGRSLVINNVGAGAAVALDISAHAGGTVGYGISMSAIIPYSTTVVGENYCFTSINHVNVPNSGGLSLTIGAGDQASNKDHILLRRIGAGAHTGNSLTMLRDNSTAGNGSAAGVDGDVLGTISFKGYNDAATPELLTWGSIIGQIASKTDGTEYGKITIAPTWRGLVNDATRDQALHLGYDASWPGLGCVVLGNYAAPASVGANYFVVAATDGAGFIARSSSDIFKMQFNTSNGTEFDFIGSLGDNPTYLTALYGNFGIFGGKNGNLDPVDRGTLRFGQSSVVPTAAAANIVKVWAADYAAGDARLYIMGEANVGANILGAGQYFATNPSCAHGMTTLAPTDAYVKIEQQDASTNYAGARITGYNDSITSCVSALELRGVVAASIASYPQVSAVLIRGKVKNGTGADALASGSMLNFADASGDNPCLSIDYMGRMNWDRPGKFTHGMTSILRTTDTYGQTGITDVNEGGFWIAGLGDSAGTLGMRVIGINSAATPTAATIRLTGAKKDSATWQDLAAGEKVLDITNRDTVLATMYGDGTLSLIRAQFDPINMADDSVQGETFNGVAGENLVWGDVVYLKSDGKFWKADFNATTTTPAVAFCTATINADATGRLLKKGWVRDDSAYNFTFGAQAGTIYLGETGAITQTAPTGVGDQVQVLGWALEADIFYFEPQLVMVEV